MTIQERIKKGESFLVANDGQFLGKLTFNKFDSESILNSFGEYGNRFSSKSIYNRFGNYGNRFSSLSPFNNFTNTPPKIYIKGSFWGYLTKNRLAGQNTVDPENLIEWLKSKNI